MKAHSISGTTKIVGIIGDPVAHSRSPAMHNAAFAALGLDYTYVAFHVPPRHLRKVPAAMRALGLAGLNVTVPHKEGIVRYLDRSTPTAELIGAVNTVFWQRTELVGDNTDAAGFLTALDEAGHRLRRPRVLVIGAGGASRAVIAAVHQRGAEQVIVANRSQARARGLARYFGRRGVAIEVAPLSVLRDGTFLTKVDLVVNATSVGLRDEKFLPMEYGRTRPDCLFYDLIYGRSTDFLRRAARLKRPTLDGLGMLLHQGAAAFTLWTGRRPPVDVMAEALRCRTGRTSVSKGVGRS